MAASSADLTLIYCCRAVSERQCSCFALSLSCQAGRSQAGQTPRVRCATTCNRLSDASINAAGDYVLDFAVSSARSYLRGCLWTTSHSAAMRRQS
jgi:hypothetical protein